jgi:KDO2-lipid IV(A) lauroyltransferase
MNPILSALLWPVLTSAGLVVSAFPRSFELWLGPKLGRLMLLLDWKRRHIAFDNIRRCLPELGPSGWERLLRENYEHYGILLLEIMHELSPVPGHFRRYADRIVRVDGLEHWRAAQGKGKGTIIITGHFANWEAPGLIAAHGVPILMSVRTIKPAWLNSRIVAARKSLGASVASGQRILPSMLKHLRADGTIGFVLDQYSQPPIGVPVRFFGAEFVHTQGAVNLIVQRTGAAIVTAYQKRDEQGFLRLVFEPEITLTPEELADPRKTTQRLVARIEAFIRANPAQWLWVHRRFKDAVWPGEAAVTQ